MRARLSAASVISLSFPVLRCCFRALLHFVRSAALPGHSVDVDGLHISHADIFISKVRAAGCSPLQCQFTIEDVFRNATIIHTADMTQPSQSALSKPVGLPRVYILGRPTRDRTSALVTLSSQDMHRIRRMLLRWNMLNLLSCPACIVHVSLPYSNVLITQAM